MARPSNYLGANLTLQDTFSSIVERSNEVAYDLGTIIVTTAPVPQANTTNGALTAGNAHIQGFFSANTMIASDALRGGSLDTSAELLVTSNTNFTGDRVYTSDTTIADFGANVTLSSASANNLTKHFVVDFGNTHITQGELRVSGNTIFDNSAAVVDIDTSLVDVTANVQVQSAFVTMNVDTVTIGSDATDDLNVNSNTVFNSDVLVGADATTQLEVNSNTVFNNDVLIGENESDLLEVNANTVINNDMYIGSDSTDQLTVDSTSAFNNNVTLGSDGTDTLTVNADTNLNANVTIGDAEADVLDVNSTTTFNNGVTVGSSASDQLSVISTTDFENSVTVGSDGTDTLIVNADSDFNANVNVDGIFTATNNATIGSDGTDTFTVNADTDFNANVTIGDAAADILTVQSTSIFNNDVTVGSNSDDDLTVNADADFNANVNVDGVLTATNNVVLGSDGTDTLTVNADSDFNANVNVDGVLTATNNVVLGSDGTDTLTVNADADFNANVNIDGVFTATNNATIGSDGTDTLTVNADTDFNANVSIGDSAADILDITATTTFNNDVTVGSDATDDLLVNANTGFVNDVQIGSNSADTLTVNADADFNANVNVDGVFTATNNATIGSDGTDQLTINANTGFVSNVEIGSNSSDALTVQSTATFNNDVTVGSDATDDLLVNANTGFVNDVQIGSDGTDTLIVNADSDFNANVNVDGVFTVTNNATIGSDGADQLTINANTGFVNNVEIGSNSSDTLTVQSTATFNNDLTVGSDATDDLLVNANTGFVNDVQIGSDGTDTLTVNATSDFNANVNIDGELVVGNNITLGASSSDTLTVLSGASFEHNVTIGNSDVDTLTVNADIASDIIPTANSTYDLGKTNARWDELFVDDATITANTTTGTSIIRNITPTLVGKNSATGYPQLTISLDANNGNSSNVVSFSTTAMLPQTSTIALGSASAEFSSAYFAANSYITSTDVQFTSAQMTIDGDQLDITSNTGITNNFAVTGDTTLAELEVTGNTDVTGDLSVTGETAFSSNTTITGTHKPSANNTYDLGATGAYFNDIYVDNFVSPNFRLKSLNDTPTSTPSAGQALVANTTGGFEYSAIATTLLDLNDTPATVTAGNVLVGNTTNGFDYSPYIDRLVDLVDVLDNAPANSHVLAYIEDSGGFEFRSPQSLSEDFSLTLDDLTDVEATAVAAGHVIVANTSLLWESKELDLSLITDVDATSTAGDVLVANTTGGFEFAAPSTLAIELNNLSDVTTTGAANSEVLTYIAATDTFEFTAYGWVLGNAQNATTGQTVTNAENVNIYGGSNITVSVGTGPQGQTNVQISQDDVVLGINDLTDAVSYDNGISIGVGADALANDDGTNNYNTAFGYQALGSVTTGTGNLGVGANAGGNIITGFNNTVIGRGAAASASNAENEITLGNNSVTDFRIPGISLTANTTAIELGSETVATQSFVSSSVSTAIGNLVDSAPGTLDTLNELAVALGNDNNFSTTITTALGTKATLDDNVSFSGLTVTDVIDGQVDDISNHDTDDLSEGVTNQYYTVTRANTAIDNRVTKAFVDGLDVDADTLDGQSGLYYLNYNNLANTPTIGNATVTLAAGTYLVSGGNFTTNQTTNETITIDHANTTRSNATSSTSPGYGGTFTAIDSVTTNATGHVTGVNTKTVTIPASDNTNTTYSLDGSGATNSVDIELIAGGSGSGTDSINVIGSGATTVAWDEANQRITIDSTNTNTNQLTTFTLTADSGTNQTIAHGNTLDIAGGTYLTTVVSGTDTVTVNHDGTVRTDDTSSLSPAAGGTFTAIDSVTTNATGHVTGVNIKTVTLPSDAQTLDGINSTSFLRSDQDDTFTGNLTINGSLITDNQSNLGSTQKPFGTITAGFGVFENESASAPELLLRDKLVSGAATVVLSSDSSSAVITGDGTGSLKIYTDAGIIGSNLDNLTATFDSTGLNVDGTIVSTGSINGGTVVATQGLTSNSGDLNLNDWTIDATIHASSNVVYYGVASHQFLGDIAASGNISANDFNSTSDARIKENVVTIDNALDKVCNMRGVYYNRIGEDDKQVGVIAQEVEAVIPELVHTNADDLKTVSYGNVVGVLIEAIKDLKAEIDELKKNQQ